MTELHHELEARAPMDGLADAHNAPQRARTLAPDLTAAQYMLQLLDPAPDAVFTFQTFDDNADRKERRLAITLHGTLDQHQQGLTQLMTQGAGVFVTVNQTSGRRTAKDVTRVRALFVDFDSARPERLQELAEMDTAPTMIIESSPGKHHAYWIIDQQGDIPLDQFKPLQQRLINYFTQLWPADGVDNGIHDLPRVMRLAGFYHQKVKAEKGQTGQPVMVQIAHEGCYYTAQEVMDWVASLPMMTAQADRQAKQTRAPIVTDDFTKDEPLGLAEPEIRHYLQFTLGNADYSTWLQVGMALHHETRGNDHGLAMWDEWSSTAPNYGGYAEHAQKWQTFQGEAAAQPVTMRSVIQLAKENSDFKAYEITGDNLAEARAIVAHLATLDPLAYALQKRQKAALLKITPTDLDKAVTAARKETEPDDKADDFILEVTPYADPVDGAALLEHIRQAIDRFIVCEPTTTTAAALWIMFTWCIDAVQVAPLACITAPEKRCGKTQLLTLIGKMAARPLPTSSITPAALFRSIEKWQPTLLIDEADTFMRENEDLRGILNAGHSRDQAFVIRTTGDNHEPTPFKVWGAKALCGIGHLPDTLKDRSILLELRRKEKNEHRQRIRHADPAEFELIQSQLCRWAQDNMESLRHARPELPDALNDRAQDNWEPLLAIADQIGGEWPQRARTAALALSGIEEYTPSLKEELLADIKAIFDEVGQPKISTDTLLTSLWLDSEQPWATFNKGKPITARQLSRMLGEFGIKSKTVRIKNDTPRGYDIADFKDGFRRYLPNTPTENATTPQPSNRKGYSEF